MLGATILQRGDRLFDDRNAVVQPFAKPDRLSGGCTFVSERAMFLKIWLQQSTENRLTVTAMCSAFAGSKPAPTSILLNVGT